MTSLSQAATDAIIDRQWLAPTPGLN
jgi:hypothetical protein